MPLVLLDLDPEAYKVDEIEKDQGMLLWEIMIGLDPWYLGNTSSYMFIRSVKPNTYYAPNVFIKTSKAYKF